MNQDVEQVWGIPRSAMIGQIGDFQGFLTARDSLLDSCRQLEPLGSFRDRPEAEEDPQWKQLIPYVCILHEDSILVLQRLKTQGEKRLHGKRSIGVGGHVNPEEPGPAPLLFRGLQRELSEEIGLTPEVGECHFLGWINDDETTVGQVHLGLAVAVQVHDRPKIAETDRMTGEWIALAELDPGDERWESWSSILLEPLLARQSFA